MSSKRDAEMLVEPQCDRHDGPWGGDETCPRCTKHVRELVGGETLAAAPSGDGTYLIVRDINDPGPMPGED